MTLPRTMPQSDWKKILPSVSPQSWGRTNYIHSLGLENPCRPLLQGCTSVNTVKEKNPILPSVLVMFAYDKVVATFRKIIL